MCRPGSKNPHRRHWKFLRVNSFVEEKLKNVELASQLKPPRDEEKTMPLMVATTTRVFRPTKIK
jgi:hypothetical protein